MNKRLLLPFILLLGLGQLGLDLAQFLVAIDHIFNGAFIQRRCFLGDMGDAQFGRHLKITAIGMEFIADQCKQAGLATAVDTGNTDSLAMVNSEVGILKQDLGATP